MKKKDINTEKEWQDSHIDETNLKKPYRDLWELYHWETIFYEIISRYDFNNKKVFVGGCGSGLFEEWLIKKVKQRPNKIVSLDLSEKQLKFAKVRCKGINSVKFVRGNLEDTKFKKNSFDVCVIIDALHHVPDLFKTLKEMKRIGKDLILSEPNALNPIRRLNELKFRNMGVKETSFYEWQLRNKLKKVNYKKIFLKHQHFIPKFTPKLIFNFLKTIDSYLSKIILLNKFSGSFLVIAKS